MPGLIPVFAYLYFIVPGNKKSYGARFMTKASAIIALYFYFHVFRLGLDNYNSGPHKLFILKILNIALNAKNQDGRDYEENYYTHRDQCISFRQRHTPLF